MQIPNISSAYSSLTNGDVALQAAKQQADSAKFLSLASSFAPKSKAGKINGDIATDFSGSFTTQSDKKALPQGAANRGQYIKPNKTIDKTSLLYEKSLELESYFVKQMLNSMRAGLSKQGINGKDSYAKTMYEDMLYDEYATQMTKTAGFGLADQIYLSLV